MTQITLGQVHAITRRPAPRPAGHAHRSGLRPFGWLLVILGLLALASTGSAAAQSSGLGAQEVEAFLEQRVPELLREHDAPGAAVAVVLPDGATVARGYGLADAATGRIADGRTPFAVGSVTKLLTWTAVMQQVEAGALSLDDPVEEHVPFDLPERFGEPLRVRHLMTHTTGLEDRPVVGLITRDPQQLPELGEVLARQVPEQTLPPGTWTAYSNYGAALAGYVVERLDGRPFASYVEAEILAPIGATDGTLHQPFLEDVEARAARGYDLAGGAARDVGAVWSTLPPAGSWWASAEDAARFLHTWLNGGISEDGGRILDAATVRAMRAPLHRQDPRLPGSAHGWWEERLTGVDLVSHGGTQPGFETILSVAPEHGIGLFVSVNATQGREVWRTLRAELLARLLPDVAAAAAAEEQAVLAGVDLAAYVGTYQGTRHGTTTIARLGKLMQRLEVGRDGDALTFFGARYLPQGDGLFVEEGGDRRLVFLGDEATATTLLVSENPRQAYHRLAWHEGGALHAGAVLAALVMLLALALAWPLWTGRRRVGARTPGRRAALVTAAAFLAMTAVFVALVADPMALASQPGLVLNALAVTGLAALAATVWTSLRTGKAWIQREGTVRGRAVATVTAASAWTLIAVAGYWNVLGFAW
jgi:CubicO group peptidase (beta-lactamase class C family)